MRPLRTCDFCSAEAVGTFEVVPPELEPTEAEQRRIVLCRECKGRLEDLLEPLLARAGADDAAGTADADRRPLESAPSSADAEEPGGPVVASADESTEKRSRTRSPNAAVSEAKPEGGPDSDEGIDDEEVRPDDGADEGIDDEGADPVAESGITFEGADGDGVETGADQPGESDDRADGPESEDAGIPPWTTESESADGAAPTGGSQAGDATGVAPDRARTDDEATTGGRDATATEDSDVTAASEGAGETATAGSGEIASLGSDETTTERAGATATEGTDPSGAEDAGAREKAESSPPRAYGKVVRLLRNREFPIDRATVEELAASAYDLEDDEVAAIVEYALEEGEFEQRRGKLYRP